MRRVYLERQDLFIEPFNNSLGDRFIPRIPQVGLHFVAWLRCEVDFARIARACVEIGIKPAPLLSCCIHANLKRAFGFGFAGWTPARIRERALLNSPPQSKDGEPNVGSGPLVPLVGQMLLPSVPMPRLRWRQLLSKLRGSSSGSSGALLQLCVRRRAEMFVHPKNQRRRRWYPPFVSEQKGGALPR
jgi:hypothetical protein